MLIDEEILKKTTLCKKNFICLEESNYLEKDNCINNLRSILFNYPIVDCNDTSCPYFSSIGTSVICQCPTRQEIYKKYYI